MRIRDGSIATDLSRPLDPQRYWLAFDLGRAPYHLLFRGVLPFVVGALVFQLHYPTPLDLLAFVVSLALAVVVSLGFRFLYNSAAFWLLDIRGVVTVAITLTSSCRDGDPDPLLPGLAAHRRARAAVRRRSCRRRSTCGSASTTALALVGVLALQVLWALALLGLGRLALRAGARKLVVQGG